MYTDLGGKNRGRGFIFRKSGKKVQILQKSQEVIKIIVYLSQEAEK